MDIASLIIFLAIGALAGWLAGNIMQGSGYGVIGNILVGIVGAVLGGFVFRLLGITAVGLIGSVITATVGAIILLFIVSIVKKAQVSMREGVRPVSARPVKERKKESWRVWWQPSEQEVAKVAAANVRYRTDGAK
jgi:uncharacterized membrane protein YeaQ/YmgE (transglycosylase-associated protein family)